MLRVVEWSWRLLEPAQARLLAALTVFHGGFDVAAAEAVCGELARHAGARLDELVAQSLLSAGEAADGTTRYALFEPVREYAMRQLAAADAAALRARHRAWLAAWAAALPATPSLAGVRAEMPNLLAALASALTDGAPEAAVRLLLPLRRVLEDVELPAEGLAAMQRAVEGCADAALRCQGHVQLSALLFLAGQADAALRQAAQGLAGASEGVPWRACALYAQARLRWRVGRRADEVLPLLDEAEALARGGDDLDLQASVLAQRGFVLDALRRAAEAEALHLESLALWTRSGNRHAINAGNYNLAVRAQNANRHASALAQLDEVERSARELQDWRRLGQALNVRGNALCGLRRWPEAVTAFREAARLAWQQLAPHDLAYVLWNLPRALAHVHDPERAVLLGAFAEAFWKSRFGDLGERDRADLRRLRRLALRQVDAARVDALWRRGASLALADAVALALR
jgi:tetratricopeptide (TPR) repeat protein